MATGIKLKKRLVEEPTLSDTIKAQQKAAKEQAKKTEQNYENNVDDYEKTADEGDIEQILNNALRKAQIKLRTGDLSAPWPSVLLIGEAGTGKTGRVTAWAKRHNINLVNKKASLMDETDMGGAIGQGKSSPDKDSPDIAVKLASTELDALEEPNSVLFLDELNRAKVAVQAPFFELANSHIIEDRRVRGNQRFLKNLLFTVAAINPDSEDYEVYDLDKAMLRRFRRVYVAADKINTRKYLDHKYDQILKQLDPQDPEYKEYLGRKAIADTLLNSDDFRFDTDQDIQLARQAEDYNDRSLQPRDLENALQWSDGTKDSFLDEAEDMINNLKLPMIRDILADYQDIEDEANKALEDGTESSVLKERPKTASDKVLDRLNKYGRGKSN